MYVIYIFVYIFLVHYFIMFFSFFHSVFLQVAFIGTYDDTNNFGGEFCVNICIAFGL